MKFFALLAALLSFASSAQAAEVQGARINEARSTIEVDIYYAGCPSRSFRLVVNNCLVLEPLQCVAELREPDSMDGCNRPIKRTLSFPLSRYAKYSGATLSIFGDFGSLATVVLP